MNREAHPHFVDLTNEDLFKKISKICNAVTVSLTDRDLLEISLKETLELFKAQRGSIFILSENGQQLILKIARGMQRQEEDTLVKKLGEGIVGKVAEMKQPIFVSDIANDKRFPDYQSRKNYRTPSFICSPLMIKDILVGVINIADKESGQNFSPQELQILDFLSSQIALNYRRTQLYKKFKTVLRESQTLKDELGKKKETTDRLQKQIVIQERLASIGKITAGIAHELNNPLDGVLRYVNLSLDQLQADEVIRGYLLEAKQGLNRMANIVKNLLACSRNAPRTIRRVNIHHAIEDALGAVKLDIYHKNIRIDKQFAQNLPEITDFGIEHIAVNLLRNSIDAMDAEGDITIKTQQADKAVEIHIKDTGCGIPEENLENIFEPFFTTKDIDKGCGLGLTITSEIIKAYNGHIAIDSQIGGGTTFKVTLPLLNDDAS